MKRATSTVILWAIVAAAIGFQSEPLLLGFVVVVATLACIEFFALLDKPGAGWNGVRLVTVLCAAAHMLLVAFACRGVTGPLDLIVLGLMPILVTAVLLLHPVEPERTRAMFFGSVFGFVYTAVLASFIVRLIYVGGAGATSFYLLFLFTVTKFSDMGAYIIGTLIGKNKFIPHISPGKTWEGIIAGAFPFAIGGGCLIYAIFKTQLPLLTWPHVLVLGVLLTVVAIIGDLAESVIKRCLEKKDSGAVLPGIGGVLDLVDSVVFTAPVMFLYLEFFA